MDELDFIEHLSRLELTKDDVIVIRTKEPLTEKQLSILKKTLINSIKEIGFNNKCLIIDSGNELGVLRKSE